LRIDWIDGETEVLGTDQSTGGGADPMAFTHGWHQSILEDFAQAIRVGCAPLATGQEALQVHAAIDAMTRASASGRTEKVCA
ncbi:MAG: Gfo/Idh/MocA family oxidoreductase, partial [Pseudomonadota bacterium]